jgi:hypothetical protein
MTPEEFWAILHAEVVEYPIFYRLYYNDLGHPTCYTMEDLPGNYIDIDKDTFARSPSNVRVRNGKLVDISHNTTSKLVPSEFGTPCDANDVTIVDANSTTTWGKKTYEPN